VEQKKRKRRLKIMSFSISFDAVTLMATIVAGTFTYINVSAIIRYPKHVFYGGIAAAAATFLMSLVAIIYNIAWINPTPFLIKLAEFFAILGKGNLLAPVLSACVAFTIAVLTGMYKK
jgi:hypothetical protein